MQAATGCVCECVLVYESLDIDHVSSMWFAMKAASSAIVARGALRLFARRRLERHWSRAPQIVIVMDQRLIWCLLFDVIVRLFEMSTEIIEFIFQSLIFLVFRDSNERKKKNQQIHRLCIWRTLIADISAAFIQSFVNIHNEWSLLKCK